MTIQEFLEQFGNNNTPHPKENREIELDFEWLPTNEQEFLDTINKAPFNILKGLGFRKYANVNSILSENTVRTQNPIQMTVMSVSSYEEFKGKLIDLITNGRIEDSSVIELSTPNLPTELLPEDQDLILFPKEWHSLIPEDFELTFITGEREGFKKEVFSDEARFGCLAYGFTRPVNIEDNEIYLINELRDAND